MTTILITGAHRGIGRELVRQAVGAGWYAIGSVRQKEHAEEMEAAFGDRFRPLVFDVRDADAIAQAARSVTEPIDVLVNNAGVIGPDRQSSLDMDYPGFELTLAINTVAPLKVTHAFLPHLRQAQKPRVLVVSSIMGSMAGTTFDRIAYRASKAAVNKLVQGLAHDLASEKFTVAAVHPGWVRTDMGGPNAAISTEASASGLLKLVASLDPSGNGRFFNYDGSLLEW